MDMSEKSVIHADPRRRAALLRLAKSENRSNEAWDKTLLYAMRAFFILTPAGLALFGVIWPSVRLLWGFVAYIFPAGLLLVFAPAFIRNLLGLQSVWHKFGGETLVLGEDYLELSMLGASPDLRSERPYVWRMSYSDIRRLEYDRKLKRLRVVGRFDEENSRKADAKGLPKGMRPMQNPEKRPESDVYLEFPLMFPDSEKLLGEIEDRCGAYMRPPRHADDMADLRDLPGTKPDHQIIKPMAVGLVLFTAMLLAVSVWQVGWLERNPYAPYPPTDKAMLGRTFAINEPAVLDGMRITLKSADVRDEEPGWIAVYFEMENTAGEAKLFRAPSAEHSNVKALTAEESGVEERETRTAEGGLVLIEPGGIYEMELYVSLRSGDEGMPIAIYINSDRWPPEKPFWREEYMGGTVEVGGARVKSNEVVFLI